MLPKWRQEAQKRYALGPAFLQRLGEHFGECWIRPSFWFIKSQAPLVVSYHYSLLVTKRLNLTDPFLCSHPRAWLFPSSRVRIEILPFKLSFRIILVYRQKQEMKPQEPVIFFECRKYINISDHEALPAGTYRIKIEGENSLTSTTLRCFDSFTNGRELSFGGVESLNLNEPV